MSEEEGRLTLDRHGRISEADPGAALLAGASRDELIGRTLPEVFPGLADFSFPEDGAATLAEKAPARFEARHPGSGRRHELLVVPMSRDEGAVVVARDVTASRRSAARAQAEHAVARVLAGAGSLEDVGQPLLQAIAGALEAEVGELWICDDEGKLRLARRTFETDAVRSARWIDPDAAPPLEPDEGLPGRAVRSRSPIWVTDLSDEGECRLCAGAAGVGLRSGMALPLVGADACFGVFCSSRPLAWNRSPSGSR